MKNLEQLDLVALDAAEMQEIQGGTCAEDVVKAIAEVIEKVITSVLSLWPF